ncbi:unnamed protein product [Caretta caretta]
MPTGPWSWLARVPGQNPSPSLALVTSPGGAQLPPGPSLPPRGAGPVSPARGRLASGVSGYSGPGSRRAAERSGSGRGVTFHSDISGASEPAGKATRPAGPPSAAPRRPPDVNGFLALKREMLHRGPVSK